MLPKQIITSTRGWFARVPYLQRFGIAFCLLIRRLPKYPLSKDLLMCHGTVETVALKGPVITEVMVILGINMPNSF